MAESRERKMSYNLSLKLRIINGLGYRLTAETMIMDFGCGSGKTVQEFRDHGYQAFGCDVKFKDAEHVNTASMSEDNIIRLIHVRPYTLPFKENMFDFIFSDQIFEHAKNYSESNAEISRVLASGGYCIHIFPSRYRPIEGHPYVPFASIIQSHPWLYLRAKMGIRTEYQKGLSATETASRIYAYLRDHTNYLSKAQIYREFKKHFDDVRFSEHILFTHSRRGRYMHFLYKAFPFLPSLYSTFRARVVLARKCSKVS
ncbi:MAG TPA: class I SAM-dependent methyltransferase [Nitrospirales bacterium]|nr:class I SAM-dependent methyltransferase [Nitrospirales bacterium]